MDQSELKPGFVYHVKDSYFSAAQDDKLMRNHEGGARRPTYFCLRDHKTQLLWMVPMSSRVEKYQPFVDRDVEKFGVCRKIVIARYGDRESAFLLQNMFPILPKYINHVHTIQGRAVPLEDRVIEEVRKAFGEVRRLHSRGARIVFPDINRLDRLMLDEMAADELA
jgi:hypothetical protein